MSRVTCPTPAWPYAARNRRRTSAYSRRRAGRAAADTRRYPVVRLCLASLSAHGESAPGQFMVGLR